MYAFIRISALIKLIFITTFAVSQEQNIQLPEFQTGEVGLFKFLSSTIIYPPNAKDNCIMGTVYVRFNVKTTGEIDSVRIAQSVHRSIDEESMRAIKLSSGKWIPGRINDTITEMNYTLPVKFTVQSGFCDDATHFYNEGVRFSNKNKYEKALNYFNLAANINPLDIDALYNCAVMKIKLNDPQGACEYLLKIKELGKPDADELLAKFCK